MAKIKAMPSEAIIGGFKGFLDFYYWCTIPVCRSWPKSPGSNRNANVRATWSAFSYIVKSWDTQSTPLKLLFTSMAQGTPLTGRDMFMRSYLSGWHI